MIKATTIPRGLLDLAALEECCWDERMRRLRVRCHERGELVAMAAAPQFADTVNNGSASVSATADTSYTAPANAQTVITAGANGTKIDELVFEGIGTTVAGTITVFMYDSVNLIYHLYDVVPVPAVAASATVVPWRTSRSYANWSIRTGWSLRVASTVANQLVKVSASANDF